MRPGRFTNSRPRRHPERRRTTCIPCTTPIGTIPTPKIAIYGWRYTTAVWTISFRKSETGLEGQAEDVSARVSLHYTVFEPLNPLANADLLSSGGFPDYPTHPALLPIRRRKTLDNLPLPLVYCTCWADCEAVLRRKEDECRCRASQICSGPVPRRRRRAQK